MATGYASTSNADLGGHYQTLFGGLNLSDLGQSLTLLADDPYRGQLVKRCRWRCVAPTLPNLYRAIADISGVSTDYFEVTSFANTPVTIIYFSTPITATTKFLLLALLPIPMGRILRIEQK